MDAAVRCRMNAGWASEMFVTARPQTNPSSKQTLSAAWPYCYLAGAGDLDKSLKLCARGLQFVPASFVSIPSDPCVVQRQS